MLHTFGRAVNINPHLHLIIPAGGLGFKGIERLKDDQNKTCYHFNYPSCEDDYYWKKVDHLEHEYLSKAWKHNLLQYVLEKTTYFEQEDKKEIMFLVESNLDSHYRRLLSILNRRVPKEEQDKWIKLFEIQYYINVTQKRSYNQTVSYVARYTKRLPISKAKILEYDKEEHIVKWQYHPHGEPAPVICTMSSFEFIDRLIAHIPPKNFRLPRYYGIFANRNKVLFEPILKKLCRFDIPKEIPTWRERQMEYFGIDPLICPCCQKEMKLVEKAYPDSKTGELKIVPAKKR